MTRLASRLSVPLILSLVLISALPLSAGGWSAGNTCGSATFKICVSKDDGNGVPRATTNLSDNSYVGVKYFNTQDNIDNSVSSMQNWYSSQDVYFYQGVGHSGSVFCVDSLYGYTSISLFWRDTFSSHLLLVNDGFC